MGAEQPHESPEPPWAASHQGNSAVMENLKLLNFTKHLDPVSLRNCDGAEKFLAKQH